MAMNTSKCNHLMPLHFKGFSITIKLLLFLCVLVDTSWVRREGLMDGAVTCPSGLVTWTLSASLDRWWPQSLSL